MISLAVVGTGSMANAHAAAFRSIKGCKIVAACDVDRDKAESFALRHGIPEVYSDVDDLLANARIDAVSNVTPDVFHAPVALKVIARGKHVLCEKPLATNYADARKMAVAAGRKGVINMVNLSYRNSPAIQKAHQLIKNGELGRIIHVEASYLQGWLSRISQPKHASSASLWCLSKKQSQGVLGDLGVHIVDFASFPVGEIRSVQCRLKTFSKVKGNRIGKIKLDAPDSAVINVEWTNGAIGSVHTTRWAKGCRNSVRLRIFGDKGGLVVDLDQSYDSFQICRGRDVGRARWKTITCGKTPDIFQRFIRSIRTGQNDQPDFARGAEVQKILDACLKSDETGSAVMI